MNIESQVRGGEKQSRKPIDPFNLRLDAERIRQIRQRMQLTQEDFAHLIGVTFSTVNRWENGKSSPNRIAARLLIGLEKKLKQQ